MVVATTITASEDIDQSGDIDFETEKGLYEFTGVLPGDYKVREVAQIGWTPIYPAAVGDEFPINTETAGDQKSPAAAVGDSERSIIVWQSAGQDGDGDGIYAQIFDVDGTPDGAEFPVNTTTAGNQSDPAVAVGPTGNFTVVWTDDALDGSGKGIFARMFGADGVPLTGEIAVNSHITGDQSSPSVAMGSGGGFVAAWTDAAQDGSGTGIYARRFTSAGLPATVEFPVNGTVAGNQQHPAVAVDAVGTITIAWDSFGQDGDGYGVYGRQFNPAGTPIGGELPVNTEIASHQLLPSITANSSGRFAIAWNSYAQDGDSYGVYAQRFNADASVDGGEFRVNTETAGSQSSPSVAMDDAGNLAFVWASSAQDGDGLGVYGQLYNSDGSLAGGEFAINSYTAAHQTMPSAAISRSGRLTVAWASNGQDTDGYGVYARQQAAFDSPGHIITLTSGLDVGGMNFGNYAEFGSIQGQKFQDTNVNHLHDPGEIGLDGWTIELVDPPTGQVIQTVVTMAIDLNDNSTVEPATESGLYEFSGVLPGIYEVREVRQAGWAQLYPDTSSESHLVLVESLQATGDVDFGNLYAPAVRVISSSMQDGDDLSGASLTYTAQFDRILRTADLDASDFFLVASSGRTAILRTWGYDAPTSTLTLVYDSLHDGEYTLTLTSGDDALEDIYRSDLDGETPLWPIPSNSSGDGIAGGDFAVGFSWSQEFFDFPTPLRRVDPGGSLIYEGRVETDIFRSDETDTFSIDLDAGQRVSLMASPGSGLQLGLEASGPGGIPLGSASASAAGQQIVLQSIPVATAGVYRFTVSGLSGSAGDYVLRLFLNSNIEDEAVGGASNDTRASAEDIDSSFIPLSNAASRGAVISLGGSATNDWYSFSLNALEPVSIMLTQLTTANTVPDNAFGLELYDSGNTLLAISADGNSNVDWKIDGFAPALAGRYYARVSAGAETEYSLIVTRDAAFDAELANNTEGGAQDITDTDVALGRVSAGLLGRVFAYDPEANVILEIDPADGTTLNTLPSPVTPDPGWDPDEVQAGLAVTESSLLLGGMGSEYIFELDPDTGDVIRSLLAPQNVVGGLAYSDGRIFLTQAEAPSLAETYRFKTIAGSSTYYEPLDKGPMVVKLSDAQYQLAKADGWLSNASSADNFPREQYEDGSEDTANPYWLCYEDYGGDFDHKDVNIKVTRMANGTILLQVNSGFTAHGNFIVDADGDVLLAIPSNSIGLELVVPGPLADVVVVDYASGDVIGTLDTIGLEGGLAADGHRLFGVSDGNLYSINPRTGDTTLRGALSGLGLGEWCTGIGVRDGELLVASSDEGTHSLDAYDLNTLAWLRSIGSDMTAALGADTPDLHDYYRLTVTAGEFIRATTGTPGRQPGEFVNLLDPMLELYDPTGALVASDDNSLDGRNALLSHSAQMDGQYVVKVASVSGNGEYIMELVMLDTTVTVDRHIFYNNSAWDGSDPAAGPGDDGAIAPDKAVLLPGEAVSSDNYSSCSRGINGVMIDINGLPDTPTDADFGIRVNDMNPDTWSDGPAPDVSVRPVDGLDRVTLIWDDGAITNKWVEVTVRAGANTGLAADDVFYFANLVGDCDGDGEIGSSDYGEFVGEFGQHGSDLVADFNADGRVDLTDFAIVRGNFGNTLPIPSFPPAAPEAVVESGLGVLSVAAAATLVDPEIAIVEALAPRDVKAAPGRRTPNNDAAAAFDLLDELSSAAGDISGAQAISIGSRATTLYRAATAEYDLRPLSDDLATDGEADDLLADILAESPLPVPL